MNDHVNKSVREKELRSLKAFRQFLAYRLLNNSRAGKSYKRLWLSNNNIADTRKRGHDSGHGRIRQQRNIKEPGVVVPGQSRTSLGHLHKRKHAFVHPGAAA